MIVTTLLPGIPSATQRGVLDFAGAAIPVVELRDGSTTATPAGCALEVAADLGAVIVGAELVRVR